MVATPYRPDFQPQNPAIAPCRIDGQDFGWRNCSPNSVAMLVDRSTIGQRQPSGCSIRRRTGDESGGTTLNQCVLAAKAMYPGDGRVQAIVVRVGANVIAPEAAAHELKRGRGMVVQGDAGALVGGSHQSTNGPVAHAVYVNEGRGWDGDIPDEVLVYDPAADGRRDMDQGPSWWRWTELLRFAAALIPDPINHPGRRLGPGKFYAAFGPDTEPHVILRYGGVKTKPFPDRTRAVAPKGRTVNVHSRPDTSQETVVDTLADGELFEAYQVTRSGAPFRGSTVWYGDQDGRGWVHAARLSHKGGST